MGINRNTNWLSQNWNYSLAIIIFLVFVNYDSNLPPNVSGKNEMLYPLTILPAFVYFIVLHPLMRESD